MRSTITLFSDSDPGAPQLTDRSRDRQQDA